MSRVIKFRAWDKATQNFWSPKPQGMIYFTLLSRPDFLGNTFCYESGNEFELRFEVMQFTGLHDKNGVEIYEGDIIKDNLDIGCVKYEEAYAGFRVCYGDGFAKWFYDYLKSEFNKVEVLGNIYQNPEIINRSSEST